MKFCLRGEADPWSPCKFTGRGVAEWGSKGHKLISSIQTCKNFASNDFKRGGGGAVHVHKAQPPPPPFRLPEMPECAGAL